MKTAPLLRQLLACSALLVISTAAFSQQSIVLSHQCGVTLDPQVDAAAKPYLDGLLAMGSAPAARGDALCAEAAAAKGDDGLNRFKAVIGAHLLYQVSTLDMLNAAQRKAIGQAIDNAKVHTSSREKVLEMMYVDVRSNAALSNISADGLAYQLQTKSPAVAKTLGGLAERWGP